MVNYTLADVLAMQTKLAAISPNRDIVATSVTALFVHGVEPECKAMRFDVSASLFAAIVQATGATVTDSKIEGRRAKVYADTWIQEGTRLGKVFRDGICVYDLEDIKVRYEIQGRSQSYGLADHARAAAHKIQKFQDRQAMPKPEPVVVVTPDQMGLDADEQAFADLCAKADWYYSYSDDNDVWRRGRDSCAALKATADGKGGKYTQVYKYYSSK